MQYARNMANKSMNLVMKQHYITHVADNCLWSGYTHQSLDNLICAWLLSEIKLIRHGGQLNSGIDGSFQIKIAYFRQKILNW